MEIYVSDLDGTLLNNKKEVTQYSKEEINKLIDKGMNFTIATARTPATVVDMMEGLNLSIPAVMMNGVLIYDINEKRYIDIKDINESAIERALQIFEEYNKDIFMYSIKDNHLWVYHKDFTYGVEERFYKERCNKPLKTFVKVEDYRKAIEGSMPINIIAFDKYEVIKGIYDKIKDIEGLTTDYYEDIYEKGCYYLESYSSEASKANGIKFLSRYVNHSKVITFGDNVNDIPMFKISDECYALENATDVLKEIATAVIGNNNDDAVAKFLKERYKG